jgi:Transposase
MTSSPASSSNSSVRTSKTTTCPPEVRSLGRTIVRWREQIVAWHQALVSNGPTEAVNNLIKRIKRIGFGFPSVRPLPHPRAALRRQAELGTIRHGQSPLKSDEPDQWGPVKGDRHASRAGRSPQRAGRDAE